MISIEFVSESMKSPRESELARLERASEMDLRYDYFFTDVSISMPGLGKEAFPKTPALDFAFSLLFAVKEVRQGDPGSISFTENDLLIHCIPDGLDLVVQRSWDPEAGSCGVQEIIAEAVRFSREILGFIVQKYPTFRNNSTHEKLMTMIAEFDCPGDEVLI
ncbi:hypothetical protein [Streptomyces sp. NPDC047028]|uniref:hypothetical protein n=1 Tax=Streptomyces sp. NPDC047028 TaxID=3155793 RepID=UPI0033D5DA3E